MTVEFEHTVAEKYKERGLILGMNNFIMRQSFGMSWDEIALSDNDIAFYTYRVRDYQLGSLDVPYSVLKKDRSKFLDEYWVYSDRLLSQTPRKFYDTIDKVNASLNIEVISPERLRTSNVEEINEMFLPVIDTLLKMSYSPRDLTD